MAVTNEEAVNPSSASADGLDQDAPVPSPFVTAPAPPPAAAPAPRKSWLGRRGLVVAAGVTGLLLVTGGAAFGSTAYVKHGLCPSFIGDKATFLDVANGTDDPAAALAKLQSRLSAKSRMLVLDAELQSAVRGLAGDVGQMVTLRRAMQGNPGAGMGDYLTDMVALFGSLNTHVRQAQLACGLPVTGIRVTPDSGSDTLSSETADTVADTSAQPDTGQQEQDCQDSMDELNDRLAAMDRQQSDLMSQMLDDELTPEAYEQLNDSLTDQKDGIRQDQTQLGQSAQCSGFQLQRTY